MSTYYIIPNKKHPLEDQVEEWGIIKGYGLMHLPCNNETGRGWIKLVYGGVRCYRCEAVMPSHIAKYFILMFPDAHWTKLKQHLKAEDERTKKHD